MKQKLLDLKEEIDNMYLETSTISSQQLTKQVSRK